MSSITHNSVSQSNFDITIEQSQPKESKWKKSADKVANFIKSSFVDYIKVWKRLIDEVKSSWASNKLISLLRGTQVGALALLHVVPIAMMVTGAVFCAMGSPGVNLLLGGVFMTSIVVWRTSGFFDV